MAYRLRSRVPDVVPSPPFQPKSTRHLQADTSSSVESGRTARGWRCTGGVDVVCRRNRIRLRALQRLHGVGCDYRRADDRATSVMCRIASHCRRQFARVVRSSPSKPGTSRPTSIECNRRELLHAIAGRRRSICDLHCHQSTIGLLAKFILSSRMLTLYKWQSLLPTSLVVQVEQSVRCVCVSSVCPDDNFWIKWPLI